MRPLPADARPRQHPRAPSLLPLVVLFCGLAAAMLAGVLVSRLYAQQQQVGLQRLADRAAASLLHRLEVGALLVRSMQAWMMRAGEVDAPEFQAFFDELRLQRSFPAVTAVAFARRVDAGGAEAWRTELIAPRQGNERLVGLDVRSQPANLQALERSRDSGEIAMSASFALVQPTGAGQPPQAVVLRVPVYSGERPPADPGTRRARSVGSLAMSFRVAALIEEALPPEVREDLALRVSDRDGADDVLLYANTDAFRWPATGPAVREFEFGGRTWRMEASLRSGLGPQVAWVPWMVFLGGAAFSALLAYLVAVQQRGRRAAERLAQLRASQASDSQNRYRQLNELLPTAVLLANAADGRITEANQAARAMFEWPVADGAIELATLFEAPAIAGRVRANIGGALELRVPGTRMLAGDGAPFWAAVAISTVSTSAGTVWMVVVSDINDAHELTSRLGFLASHDPLTELFNRREFERRLQARLDALAKGGAQAALLYVDLDQFKLVNDTSGHQAGDQLLQALSADLGRALPDGAVLARLGGDEFGVLVEADDSAQALAAAAALRSVIEGFGFSWGGRRYGVTASIGVVLLQPGEAHDANEVFARADTACHLAKEHGRNRVHLFSDTDADAERMRADMDWAGRLTSAMAEDRLRLYFQEIRPLAAGSTQLNIEILVRLVDEAGGVVLPGGFLPAAERFGVIAAIDRWVLRTTLQNFDRLHPDKVVDGCSVNLSAHTLADPDFVGFVTDCLADSGVAPGRLCFEITETVAMSRPEQAVERIQLLRALGCRFAIDDFGSGMSSFGYLKDLPVDNVKIDGRFVRELDTDPMSLSIVQAVTAIGHQGGKTVTAEMVSSTRALEMLAEIGVDYVQGFALHRPQPIAAHAG